MEEKRENKGVRAVFKNTYEKYASWLTKPKQGNYLELSHTTFSKDIDSFLNALFDYNNIDYGTSPQIGLKNLLRELQQEHIVLGGGILFFEDNKMISPSCCSGLEAWREVSIELINQRSPWLGRDPYPVFEYRGENIRIWSGDCLGIYGDKQPRENLICIEFEKEQLASMLAEIEITISHFITNPFYTRIKELDNTIADELTSNIKTWLLE